MTFHCTDWLLVLTIILKKLGSIIPYIIQPTRGFDHCSDDRFLSIVPQAVCFSHSQWRFNVLPGQNSKTMAEPVLGCPRKLVKG